MYIHEEVFREMNPRCTVQSNVSLSRPNHWLHTQHSELSHLFSTLFGVFNLAIPSLEWLFSKHWNCTLMSQHTVAYSACNYLSVCWVEMAVKGLFSVTVNESFIYPHGHDVHM